MTLAQVAAALLTLALPAEQADNASIDAYYDRLAQARATDFAAIAESFHPLGLFVFLSPQGPGPVVSGDEVPGRARAIAERMRNDGMTMTTGYRIERRSVLGDVAVDTGYMRSTQTMNNSSRSNYARFLITLKREGDSWRVISDAAWPSNEATYNAVPRTPGLRYDS